jgi:cytochrome P450
MSPWALHYDEQFFPQPKLFQPERFVEDKYGFSYLPFGAGPRGCLGKLFAFFEAKLVVSIIVQKVKLELVSMKDVDSDVAITLRPRNGIICTATKV